MASSSFTLNINLSPVSTKLLMIALLLVPPGTESVVSGSTSLLNVTYLDLLGHQIV